MSYPLHEVWVRLRIQAFLPFVYFVKTTTPFVPWEPCSENICLQKHTALLGCLDNISICSEPIRVLRSDSPAQCHPLSGLPYLSTAATWAGQQLSNSQQKPREFSQREDGRTEQLELNCSKNGKSPKWRIRMAFHLWFLPLYFFWCKFSNFLWWKEDQATKPD